MKGGHGWWRTGLVKGLKGGGRSGMSGLQMGTSWLGREVRLDNFQAYVLEGEKGEMS